jgi:hypothetical protein
VVGPGRRCAAVAEEREALLEQRPRFITADAVTARATGLRCAKEQWGQFRVLQPSRRAARPRTPAMNPTETSTPASVANNAVARPTGR